MLTLLLHTLVSAHIVMDEPPPVTDEQKDGPCGEGAHVRGDDVTVLEPGQTLEIVWHETVHHTSTYRISFDDDGDDSFEDPATPDDYYTNDAVLLDEIPDEPGKADYTAEITLPDIECETCTLQLIQLMTDKPPYAPGTNDIYYQCADLALRRTVPPPPGDTDEGATQADADEGRGCSTAAAAGGWPIALLLGAITAAIRPCRARAGSRTDRPR